MGTILVPLFAHYRPAAPPVQAAYAEGLRSLCGSDSIWILISSIKLSTPKSVNARAAERLHGDDTTVPKAGLFTHFFKPDAAAGNWQVDFLCGQA
jgi:hypothetical protein